MASVEMAEKMLTHLDAGIVLMLFPEATTTDGSNVRRFGSKLLDPAIASQSLKGAISPTPSTNGHHVDGLRFGWIVTEPSHSFHAAFTLKQ